MKKVSLASSVIVLLAAAALAAEPAGNGTGGVDVRNRKQVRLGNARGHLKAVWSQNHAVASPLVSSTTHTSLHSYVRDATDARVGRSRSGNTLRLTPSLPPSRHPGFT